MTDIMALAIERARCKAAATALGLANRPTEAEAMLRADARYKLAQDAFDKADTIYRHAIIGLSPQELLALAEGEFNRDNTANLQAVSAFQHIR